MSKRVLIVDDEKPLARALELKLAYEGLDAKAVYNGNDAIAELKASKYDVVLLDLVMPKEDGFRVLQDIRTFNIKTLVIVSSNLSQEEDISRAKSLGAVDYFVKSDTTLADVVKKTKAYLAQ